MAKYSALTVRRLKPGTYDDWRKAWEGDGIPEGVHAYILRNVKDPDEIIAFGFTDRSMEEMRGDPSLNADAMAARQAAMAPFVDSTGADGIYEVIDEVNG
jgi:hypothetical protein